MKPEAENLIRNKMRGRGISDDAVEDFVAKVRRACAESGFIQLPDVMTPGPDRILQVKQDVERNRQLEALGAELLNRLVVVKLNGGLSTTMGGQTPKGVLVAKDGLSYLEIVIAQMEALSAAYGLRMPLMLMNSFFTHGPTMEIVGRRDFPILTLIQNQVPRLIEDSFVPLETGTDQDWAPPGHGDLFDSLRRSGFLERLIEDGYRWIFISNLDNLAACVEPWILGLMAEEQIDFLMEVTDRTHADRKGGTPVVRNGRLELLEIAQVEERERDEFQDIHRFPFFNTNNIWVDLKALSSALSQGILNLPIIQNRKSVAQRQVVQIETAMGAALGCFPGARALGVGRERFFPTKKVSDLFVLGSDACVLDSMSRLRRNPLRPDSLPFMPHVFLSEDFLDSPLAIRSRFEAPDSVSLLQAESFEVFGSVFFESNVSIEGRVEVRGGAGETYRVHRGSVLRDGRYPPIVTSRRNGSALPGPELYPMELSRTVVEKIWGSASIGWGLSREMDHPLPIGELWETFDGEEEGSVILNGIYRRKGLRRLMRELGTSLMGRGLSHFIDKGFPLLIKYLFPSQTLSLQVHPDDEYAQKHEKSNGKTEMWIVLNAAQGAFIALGWKEGLNREEIVSKILERDFSSIINTIYPKAGDVYFIPSGTVHALGPGMAVLEIQQNSDITYRLYDWGRETSPEIARPLSLDKAMDVLDFGHVPEYRIPSLSVAYETGECSYLCACRHFASCRWILDGRTDFVSDITRFWVLNVVSGQGSILCPKLDPVWAEQGSTILIPAGLGGFAIEPSGSMQVVKSWVPNLEADIVMPLRQAGFSDSEIAGLAGMGSANDLHDIL